MWLSNRSCSVMLSRKSLSSPSLAFQGQSLVQIKLWLIVPVNSMFCKSIAESLIQLLTSRLNMLVHVQSVFKILHLICSLCFSWLRTSSVSCEEFAVRTVPSLDCEKWFVHFACVSLGRRLNNRSSAVIGQFD